MQRSKSHTPPNRTPSDNVNQRVGIPINSNNANTNTNNNPTPSVPTVNNNSTINDNRNLQQKGLEWVLGRSVRVKTLFDEEYEGEIYAYDLRTNCVVLQSSSSPNQFNSTTAANNVNNNTNTASINSISPKFDFRILKISFLKDVVQIPNRRSSIDISTNNNAIVANGQNTKTSTSLPSPTLSTANINNNNNIFSTFIPSVSYVQMDRIQTRDLQAYKETRLALARIGVGVTQEAQDIFDALSKTLPCRWADEKIVVLDEVIINPPYDLENCKASSSASGSLARVRKVLEGEKRRLANIRKQ